MSETLHISKLTKRQRVAILSFRAFIVPTLVWWMPKTMESMISMGLTEQGPSGKSHRLTQAGREALVKILKEERGRLLR